MRLASDSHMASSGKENNNTILWLNIMCTFRPQQKSQLFFPSRGGKKGYTPLFYRMGGLSGLCVHVYGWPIPVTVELVHCGKCI